MSVLRVAKIVNQGANSAPTFSRGLSIGEAATLTANVNVTGVCTATKLVGDGANMTNTGGVLPAKAITLMTIIG